ncbi:MAG: hypothetical protein J3K34DRAFT_518987 [Monoraphidium minutum]|nr:MAG: hypothetical protein J3K34DRAFT_518987 [Monoraphidium minutum]
MALGALLNGRGVMDVEANGSREAPAEQGADAAAHVGERGSYLVDEHLLSPQETAAKFGVEIDWSSIAGSKGLTADQVKLLREEHGLNRLTPPKERPEIIKFLIQFTNPLMALLVVAGSLTYMAYGIQSPRDRNNLILASALVIVVTLTCTMSYFQERSASNVMASLKAMMPAKCTVQRDGQATKVEAHELVPGDLVSLRLGDRVPADIRIIESYDLKVECSSLTGESDLVAASVERRNDAAAEAGNLVFMSSLAMNGEGRGIVIRTGDQTMIGKIATLASDTNTHRSTLQIEVHRLVVFVGILAFTMGILLFVVGVARKMDPLGAFVNGFILVVVANVPEGLPATVTSLLTLTALRLRDRKVLIKRTDIIENLGVATIIASDKTGTLTQNRMSVGSVWANQELHEGAHFQPPSKARRAGSYSLTLAPEPILERVSRLSSLARLSRLSRRSNAPLARQSKQAAGARRSIELREPAAPSALRRVSLTDHAAHMALGRVSRLRGDGTLEVAALAPAAGAASGPPAAMGTLTEGAAQIAAPAPPSPAPLALHTFAAPEAVSWPASSSLVQLLTVATVCNKAKYDDQGKGAPDGAGGVAVAVPSFVADEDRKMLGDATDCGLLRYCDRRIPCNVLRRAYKIVFDIPFNSANKWAVTITQCPGMSGKDVVMMKGAPEIVLTKCTHHLHNRQEKPIDEEFKQSMLRAYESCGFMGERVIGFAYKLGDARGHEEYRGADEAGLALGDARGHEEYRGADEAALASGLVFLGLVSLVDPPREGVLEAVDRCRNAGIRVAMVTGDHPLTAEAIARKVGIVTMPTPREVAAEAGVPLDQIAVSDERVGAVVVTGAQIRRAPGFAAAQIAELTTEEEWDDILCKPEIVFARTSPQQKLQIVENLQRLGEVVAVTGDGVNDAPALKRAQIGVAMGKGGSDVAREAADIVLMDDQFPSIVNAIEEGRTIYDNLKKTIAYTLTHATPEVLPLFLNLVLNMPLGLSGLLILSIDLLTEQGPAISLAYEHAEANVMARPPRDLLEDRLVDGPLIRYSYLIAGMAQAVFCLIAFFTVFWWHEVPLAWTYNTGNTHWTPDAPPFEGWKCAGAGGCRDLDGPAQTRIYWEAQAAWYVTLVMCQFWHIFTCKTRQVSIFRHGPLRNPVTLFGVTISLGTILVITYVPFLQPIFTTATLTGVAWLPQLGFAGLALAYTEYSKRRSRADPDGWWARRMQW